MPSPTWQTSAAERAAHAWGRIQDKATSLVILRDDETYLDAQAVRVEYSNNLSEASGGGGSSAVREVVIFGVRGHATVVDTDIERGDRFALDGKQFVVVDVVYQTGEIQAHAEART